MSDYGTNTSVEDDETWPAGCRYRDADEEWVGASIVVSPYGETVGVGGPQVVDDASRATVFTNECDEAVGSGVTPSYPPICDDSGPAPFIVTSDGGRACVFG